MIKEVKLYTIICDNCGKDAAEDTEYTATNNPWEFFCEGMDWTKDPIEKDMHYCPDCKPED